MIGTGLWTIISGLGGSVVTPTDPNSVFNGTSGTTYQIEWTITNGPCESRDTVTVTFQVNPTTANAGPDQTGAAMCGLTSTNLAGNTPVVGTGLWTIVSGAGGTVVTPTSETSAFNGVAGTTYQIEWAITNGPCVSRDTLTVTFEINPTPSNMNLNFLYHSRAAISMP